VLVAAGRAIQGWEKPGAPGKHGRGRYGRFSKRPEFEAAQAEVFLERVTESRFRLVHDKLAKLIWLGNTTLKNRNWYASAARRTGTKKRRGDDQTHAQRGRSLGAKKSALTGCRTLSARSLAANRSTT